MLTQQLVQAHDVFLLHHGPTLDELFVKLPRDRFCGTLERYWNRFARSWDVLLHGNPAVDVLGGIKLASGGELGFGVGEEEWGSGEREVLEDLTRRTEGLVDVVAARFGTPTPSDTKTKMSLPEAEALPWLGRGHQPAAADGVVFGGVGAVSRPTLRSISYWMQHVYTYGDYAYGVRDNPNRERRKRRRLKPPPRSNGGPKSPQSEQPSLRKQVQEQEAAKQDSPSIDPALLPKDPRPQMHDRVASHDHATNEAAPQVASHPGVPPPIVSAAEQALNKATEGAGQQPQPTQQPQTRDDGDDSTTMGIPDQYMKYMTFGLSSLAKSYTKKRPEIRRSSTGSSKTIRPRDSDQGSRTSKTSTGKGSTRETEEQPAMSQVDPMPDGEDIKAKIAQQIREENKGHFIIGLKGDLELGSEQDDESMTEGSFRDESGGSRTVLRTLQVEMTPKDQSYAEQVNEDLDRKDDGKHIEPENPATKNMKRLRVLIYVRRPFMYCFLFEQRTASLSYSSLYKSLHRTLVPIHKPLLSSTSVEKVAQRIEASHANAASDTASQSSKSTAKTTNTLPSKQGAVTPIFDLLYDPARLTVHTSIPNIPEPGTPAAEGILTSDPAPWSRIEALNVHSQILNTLAATTASDGSASRQIERTSKTTRGWWVVYLRLPPSIPADDERPTTHPTSSHAVTSDKRHTSLTTPALGESTLGIPSTVPAPPADTHRIAFLVRKAGDATTTKSSAKISSSASGRLASGMWNPLSLGRGNADTGGSKDSWGPGALANGIGFDARGYVEGLLSLNR